MAPRSPELRLVQAPDPRGPGPVSLEDAYRAHAPYLASVCLRILGSRHEVEDVVHDVFLAAERGLKKCPGPAAARAWLLTVAVRISRRRLRRRRLKAFLGFSDAPAYVEVADATASPGDRALLIALYRVLDRLPANERIAWLLRHAEGRRLDEVAEVCRCSLATAKRRIAAAQAVVHEVLGHD